jgi:hypothetical protein
MRITNVRGAKSEFGPDEKGIDVVFDLTGRRFGAPQHTVFHFDEGQAPGRRGSPARAMEEAAAPAKQIAFGMWANPDYRPALARRDIVVCMDPSDRFLSSVGSASFRNWIIGDGCCGRAARRERLDSGAASI